MTEKTIERRLEELANVKAIQLSPGNFDVNEYMRGMANGLILADAIMNDHEPVYIEHPDKLKEARKRTPEEKLSTATNEGYGRIGIAPSVEENKELLAEWSGRHAANGEPIPWAKEHDYFMGFDPDNPDIPTD